MSKILIIEDNKALLNALKVKFVKEGYDVVTAEDGEEALRLFREQPNCVLLDILLPKKTGMEVLEEIQQFPELKKIPVIIISNSGQPVEIERARELGAKDFLIKTDFTPQDVMDKLVQFCPLPSAATPKEVEQHSIGKGFVFVVEDDSFLRKLLTDKLRREGFSVEEAAGGKEAIDFLRDHVPSVVLLDLVMPSVDGFQVLQEIRSRPSIKDIPVIVLSNLGEREHIDRAKALGADEYLVKAHFILDEIIDKINKVISKRYV